MIQNEACFELKRFVEIKMTKLTYIEVFISVTDGLLFEGG